MQPKPDRNSLLARVNCVILGTVLASVAFAAEKPFAAPEVVQHAPATGAGSLLQVTFSLALVLAAVFAAAWLVRRLRGFGKFGVNVIQVVADAPLGTKERAVLIQVGEQQLLLGVTPGQVNLLHVLAQPIEVNSGQRTADSAGGDALRPEFKAILKRSLGLK
ncbi:MAG TPA: flagellar biosynthetic protein FliO [Povalibacter sp.]